MDYANGRVIVDLPALTNAPTWIVKVKSGEEVVFALLRLAVSNTARNMFV